MAAPPPHRIRVVCRLRPRTTPPSRYEAPRSSCRRTAACASRGTSYQHKVGCGLALMPSTIRARSKCPF